MTGISIADLRGQRSRVQCRPSVPPIGPLDRRWHIEPGIACNGCREISAERQELLRDCPEGPAIEIDQRLAGWRQRRPAATLRYRDEPHRPLWGTRRISSHVPSPARREAFAASLLRYRQRISIPHRQSRLPAFSTAARAARAASPSVGIGACAAERASYWAIRRA